MTSLDLAALAYDTVYPDAELDFEELSADERERWELAVDAVRFHKPLLDARKKKLEDYEVMEIRAGARAGRTYAAIAAHYGVSASTVGQIVRGEIRRDV